jgi:hypothetical protein
MKPAFAFGIFAAAILWEAIFRPFASQKVSLSSLLILVTMVGVALGIAALFDV